MAWHGSDGVVVRVVGNAKMENEHICSLQTRSYKYFFGDAVDFLENRLQC